MRGPTRPFSFIRTLTVGFGVTPNLLTLLPKGFQNEEPQEEKALAGLGFCTLTAGGEFHPALRTRPLGMSGLEQVWRRQTSPARTFPMAKAHVPMPKSAIRPADPARWPRIRRAGLACRESDSGLFSLQKLTLPKSCG